ncbi:MAG: hypothetical protein GY816_14280 [Cytophagales bacterium]|nr:hypothetical protein [Cytophagales bacterium]
MISYILLVLFIGFLALIDFLTLGWLKRFKLFSKIYYPIYWVISVVTLSRLYRSIYYSILSNLSKWKISIILVVFVIVSFYSIDNVDQDYPGESFSQIELWSDRQGVDAYSGNYDDQNGDKYSNRAHIQSDIIRGNTVRLFVVARADNEENIRKNCNYDSLVENLDTARMYINLHCVSSYYKVFIDDSLVQDIPWKFHFKASTQQRGLLTWINVRSLQEGLHELKIKGANKRGDQKFSTIPFYREYSEGLYIPDKRIKEKEKDSDYMSIKPLLPK